MLYFCFGLFFIWLVGWVVGGVMFFLEFLLLIGVVVLLDIEDRVGDKLECFDVRDIDDDEFFVFGVILFFIVWDIIIVDVGVGGDNGGVGGGGLCWRGVVGLSWGVDGIFRESGGGILVGRDLGCIEGDDVGWERGDDDGDMLGFFVL